MSTILKALEKLEREKEAALRATGPMPVISTSGTARGAPAGWYLKPWLWLGLVGVIIMVLGGTAWHFYRQSRGYVPRQAEHSAPMDHPPAQHPAAARSQPATAPITAAEPEPLKPDPMPDGRRQTADPVLPQANGDQASSQRPGKTSVQEKPAMQQPMSATGTAVPSDSARNQITPEKAPATDLPTDMEKSEKVETPPTGSPAQPDTASKSNPPADVYKNTPLLADGRLRVHAIAWAPQPEERMAVINSRVLHEGDSVEDFVVMVIRPDDVVVREKGKGVWRVEFGRP